MKRRPLPRILVALAASDSPFAGAADRWGTLLILPGGINLTAKCFRESTARNGPRGEIAWISLAIPLP